MSSTLYHAGQQIRRIPIARLVTKSYLIAIFYCEYLSLRLNLASANLPEPPPSSTAYRPFSMGSSAPRTQPKTRTASPFPIPCVSCTNGTSQRASTYTASSSKPSASSQHSLYCLTSAQGSLTSTVRQ